MNKKNYRKATVRVGPLTNIPATLWSLGYERAPIFKKAGFQLKQFENPDQKIPFIKGSKLLTECVCVTGCHHFGLLLGMRSHPSELGIVGYLLRVAPDVRTGLQVLLNYLDLHDEGGMATFETNDDITLLGYTIIEPRAYAVDQIYDLSMVMICNIMRGLCGEKWAPTEILMMKKSPNNKKPYKDLFQSRIRFNSDTNAVAFPSKWLDLPLEYSDSFLFKHLLNEAEALRANQDIDLITKLRQLLHQCLLHDGCSLQHIAEQLGMHERTLNRRLKAEDTTFRDELERVKFSVSQQLLSSTNAPLEDISNSLGYADSTAFIRAFKRWSDQTPSQWRNAKQ